MILCSAPVWHEQATTTDWWYNQWREKAEKTKVYVIILITL